MAPVTEFATIPLKAGTSLDPSSETGKLMQSVLDTLRAQPGFQKTYYAQEIENPGTLRLAVDWDSLDAHKKFMGTPEYAPFMKSIAAFMDGKPVLVHAEMKPFPPTALSPTIAPATEVIYGYFDPSISSADQAKFASNVQKLIDVIASHAPGNGFKGAFSSGWVLEPMTHNGAETKAFVGCLGWESREAHMAFRETQAFKDNAHLLREVGPPKGMEMFHVKNAEVQPGQSGPGLPVQEEVLNPHDAGTKAPSTTSDGMSTKYTK